MGFDEKNFDTVIFLMLLIQQFYNVLIFGVLDPIKISYFGIALMISVSIPLVYSPIRGYLTPEINEKGELKSKDRIKYYAIYFILQLVILLVLLSSVNFFFRGNYYFLDRKNFEYRRDIYFSYTFVYKYIK